MVLKDTIRTIPDFPIKGVMYRDLTTLMTNAKAFAQTIEHICAPYLDRRIDNVAAIEARGFIFGSAVAARLGAGFVPIRKAGKLPYRTYSQSYDLEYGSDTLEIHADAIRGQERILLVDDLIATGGTAQAAVHLLRKTGGNIVGAAFVVDLPELGGMRRLVEMGVSVTALTSFALDER